MAALRTNFAYFVDHLDHLYDYDGIDLEVEDQGFGMEFYVAWFQELYNLDLVMKYNKEGKNYYRLNGISGRQLCFICNDFASQYPNLTYHIDANKAYLRSDDVN